MKEQLEEEEKNKAELQFRSLNSTMKSQSGGPNRGLMPLIEAKAGGIQVSTQLSGSLGLRAVSLFSLAAESQLMDVISWDVIW